MNFLIETKQEYTIHLVNSLYPLIYEGIQNIYEEAKKTAKTNDELKIFQIMLSDVPKWNPNIIDVEYQRILRLNNLGKTIEELLKAVIKANISVLTNSNIQYDDKLLKELNIQDDFKNFIHLVYIECARTFYNTPFLFYHRESALDIKRNQSEIFKVIQECIKNAIRKMIPLQITIKTYLGKNNQNGGNIATDLKSESNQIKNMLASEKRKADATPSSPRPLDQVLASSVKSEDFKSNSLLKNNKKVINFSEKSEKTLRDSILNGAGTEQDKSGINHVSPSGNLMKPPVQSNLNKVVMGIPSGNKQVRNNTLSESSVYYDPGANNVIEEYSNNNALSPLNESETKNQNKSSNKDNKYKYFSHLNV